ncbi:MAG: hypothetical protein C0592_09995 [Marinilabiliales bacterium]|nr:MAG: hypothetical protein C0592_09995 [Marinilabiliales bacterium]
MRLFVFILCVYCSIFLHAQTTRLQGYILNNSKEPLAFATVALLYPSDSTLAYFGISNKDGKFEIKYVPEGTYIMQIAYLGYETHYEDMNLPNEKDGNLGAIILQEKSTVLSSVEVADEYIPIQFKNDTIEYNAAAFRTKPNDNVEELLRKLPGVEVDRAGNIKVVGEDVVRVLVDGKEFFSSDPKVPTKNLPADAIDKIQTYDQKSDEAELTGIEDGTREKTINLVLKDDKKKAWIGYVEGGYGTDNHYMSNAKLYRFSSKHQIAFLGMANNINEFGFSFQDYMDFNGGIGSMMSGGNIEINLDNSTPVNFGQTVNGLVNSQAGGFNYSYEKVKNKRFYISYLGSAYTKDLTEDVYSQNFTPQSSYIENSNSISDESNQRHPLTFGYKNKSDSVQHFIINGNASYGAVNYKDNSLSEQFSNDTLINMVESRSKNKNTRAAASLNASWLRKGKKESAFKLFKSDAGINYSHSLDQLKFFDYSHFPELGLNEIRNQYQNDENEVINGSFSVSTLIKTGKKLYISPGLSFEVYHETLLREQGIPSETNLSIDSLSPKINYLYSILTPSLEFKRNTKKAKLSFGVEFEISQNTNSIDADEVSGSDSFILSFLYWEKEIKTGRRLSFMYHSGISRPRASQLNPVENNINPLNLYRGNRYLRPEKVHSAMLQYMLFDQFSSTSLFLGINGSYTLEKMSWSRTVNSDLSQNLFLENVPYEYAMRGMLDFSTPIRKLGINTSVKLRENWSQGISRIDNTDNINTSFSHKVVLSLEKRKHEKLDISGGVSYEINDTRYSIRESMSYKYYNFSYFGEIGWTPNDSWSFELSADIMNYQADNFEEALSVPLLNAEMSYNFLKNKRASITIKGFDLLNKNSGIERSSYENYLRESRTNIIGRFYMLSLRFRINKFKGNNDGLNIEME